MFDVLPALSTPSSSDLHDELAVPTPNMLQMFVLGGMNRGLYILAFIARL